MVSQPRLQSRAFFQTEWVPLEDVSVAKGLTQSDWVRIAMAKHTLMPRFRILNGKVWVHTPSLIDWDDLLDMMEFQTEAQLQSHDGEGAHHAA